MPLNKSRNLLNTVLISFALMLAGAFLHAQTQDADTAAPAPQQVNPNALQGPSKMLAEDGKTEVIQDNTPLPDCNALIQQFWEVFNSGNCKRAYEMLGATSRKSTTYDKFMNICDPREESEKLMHRLNTKFSTYTVTSCARSDSRSPESLVEAYQPQAYDSILLPLVNSLQWSSDSDKKDLVVGEKQKLDYLRNLLDKESLPQDKLVKSSAKYYFSNENGTWKIEIPHMFWTSARSSAFGDAFKMIDEGRYEEANTLLKGRAHEGYFDQSYPHLVSAVLEFNRMRNTRFPLDITDKVVKIKDGKLNISGNIVNRGTTPIVGIMAKVYYMQSNGNVLLVNEFLLLSTLGVTLPKITGQVDPNGRKPFSIDFYGVPPKTERVWLTISGYTD